VNAARRRVLALAIAAAVAGCSLAPVDVETRKAVLSALPADIPAATPVASTLLVLPTHAAAAYDTTQMAYSTAPYEVAYFARNEWADTPAHMLNALLVRTIDGMRRFRAVAAGPQTARPDYALATELIELRQDFTVEPPLACLALRAELRDAQGRTFASKTFETSAPMAARSPQAGAAAANAAAAQALREIASFVAEGTR
jgi:cholesterol transport system auxiliary component